MELSQIKNDKKAVNEGCWTDDLGGGFKLKIAKYGNAKHLAAMHKVANKYPAIKIMSQAAAKDAENEELVEDILQITVDTLLFDWCNVFENGVELPFSKETAKRIMREYDDFYALVQEQCNNAAWFRSTRFEENLKNS